MNYRHSYHAGNFADVHKHAVLGLILRHLSAKPAAFRVLDTHAGAGLYDLAAEEATRTGEWREGIGRLREAGLPVEAEALLAPYRAALSKDPPPSYPGSPLISLALMRPQDRLTACELAPQAAAALAELLRREARAKAVVIDGWTALRAYLPPKERRGLVLIDPPYEQPDEFDRLPERLLAAHQKWPTGIYLAWYPIKDRAGADRLAQALTASGIPGMLRSELVVGPPAEPQQQDRARQDHLQDRPRQDRPRLVGSGLIAINPPWRLDAELSVLGPALAQALAPGGQGRASLAWLREAR